MQHVCQVSHATFVPSGAEIDGREGLVLLMIIIVGTQTQKLTKVNKSKH